MIELNNVSKIYTNKTNKVTALKNINLNLPNSGLITILGTSGSGKTTLLNIIGTIDFPTSGKYLFNNQLVDKKKSKNLESIRRNNISIVFQENYLIKDYNVEDNIKLPLEIQGVKNYSERIENTLNKVMISEKKYSNITELSGGQKQRVTLSRAIVKDTNIILADEPTGNLDEKTELLIFKVLKEISREKLVVLVTHNRQIASTYSDRIIEIKDGEIIYDCSNEASEISGIEIHGNQVYVENNMTIQLDDWIIIKKLLLEKGKVELKLNEVMNNSYEKLQFKSLENNFSKKNTFKSIKRIVKKNLYSMKFKHIFFIITSLIVSLFTTFLISLSNYDTVDMTYNSFISNDYQYVRYSKEPNYYQDPNNNIISDTFISELETEYGSNVRGLTSVLIDIDYDYSNGMNYYERFNVFGYSYVNETEVNILYGSFPTNDAILLTDYLAEILKNSNDYKNIQEIVGEKVQIGRAKYLVSGIIETTSKDYIELKSMVDDNDIIRNDARKLINEFENNRQNIYSRIYYSKDIVDNLVSNESSGEIILNYGDIVATLYLKDEYDSNIIIEEFDVEDGIYVSQDFYDSIKLEDEGSTIKYIKNRNNPIYIKGILNVEDNFNNYIYASSDIYKEILNEYYSSDEMLIEIVEKDILTRLDDLDYIHHSNISTQIYEIEFVLQVINKLINTILFIIVFMSIMGIYYYVLSLVNSQKQNVALFKSFGMRSRDLYLIFISENLIVFLMEFILIMIGVFLFTDLINNYISERIEVNIQLINTPFEIAMYVLFLYILVKILICYWSTKRYISKSIVDLIK